MWKTCGELRFIAGKIWDLAAVLCQVPHVSHLILSFGGLINSLQQQVVRYFISAPSCSQCCCQIKKEWFL